MQYEICWGLNAMFLTKPKSLHDVYALFLLLLKSNSASLCQRSDAGSFITIFYMISTPTGYTSYSMYSYAFVR